MVSKTQDIIILKSYKRMTLKLLKANDSLDKLKGIVQISEA